MSFIRAPFQGTQPRPFPRGYVKGAAVNWATVASVVIGTSGQPSFLRSSTDQLDISFTGLLSVSFLAGVGVPGGLDAGVEAANTWYAVHVIADSRGINAVAGLFSTSATAPVLPAGYDQFRRVGWARNNAASNLFTFVQFWDGFNRLYFWMEDSDNFLALEGGTATVPTAVSLAAFVPPTSRVAILSMEFVAANAGSDAGLRPTGELAGVPRPDWTVNLQVGVATTDEHRQQAHMMTNASQSIDYEVSEATSNLDISVTAYIDSI